MEGGTKGGGSTPTMDPYVEMQIGRILISLNEKGGEDQMRIGTSNKEAYLEAIYLGLTRFWGCRSNFQASQI